MQKNTLINSFIIVVHEVKDIKGLKYKYPVKEILNSIILTLKFPSADFLSNYF